MYFFHQPVSKIILLKVFTKTRKKRPMAADICIVQYTDKQC